MSPVGAAVGIGVDDFQTVFVADLRRPPAGIALGEGRGHRDAGFQDEVACAAAPGIHSDRPVDGLSGDRLFDVVLLGRSVAPPGVFGDLFGTGGEAEGVIALAERLVGGCLLYTSPSPRDKRQSRMPSSA